MSNPADKLPKRIKFRKFEKHSNHRQDVMAISLPESVYSPVYVNARLTRWFKERGVERVHIMTDAEEEAIALTPTADPTGYFLTRPSESTMQLNARLRRVMPTGRYAVSEKESSDEVLVFRKEYSTFKYGKDIFHGKDKKPAH